MNIEKTMRSNRLGIDFDGVVQVKTERVKNFCCLEQPIDGAKEALECLKKQGYKLIIYTARPWWMKPLIKYWFNHYEIPFDKIICGKPICMYYIDDHAIEFKDWKQTLGRIK